MHIKCELFKGEAPKVSPNLLPDGYAQTATNCRLDSGALSVARRFDQGLDISSYVGGSARKIFKMHGETLLGTEKMAWLAWNHDVDVVPGTPWGGADRIFWSESDGARQSVLDLFGANATETEDQTKIFTPSSSHSLPLSTDYPTLGPACDIWYSWNLAQEWGNGISYAAGDTTVLKKTLTFKCLKAHTPSSCDDYVGLVATDYNTAYKYVEYMAKYWAIVIGEQPTGEFSASTGYAAGDVVYMELEHPCVCIQNHISDNPDPAFFEFKTYSTGATVQYYSATDISILLKYTRNSTAYSGSVPPIPTNSDYWTVSEEEPLSDQNINTPGFGSNWGEYWAFEYSGDSLGLFAYAYTFVTAWGAETKPSPVYGPKELKEREFVGVTIPRDTVKYPDNYGFPEYVSHIRLYRTETGSETGTDFYYVPYYSYQGEIDGEMTWGSLREGMPIADIVDGKQYYDANINSDGQLPTQEDFSINRMLEEALETLLYDPVPEMHFDADGNEMDIVSQSYGDVYLWQLTSVFKTGRFVEHNNKIYRAIVENANIEPGATLGWENSWEFICNAITRSEYMEGLTALPGGIFCGFIGKNLYFSEPYLPHAWPADYKKKLAYSIVGIGVYGQDIVVCTTGNPYVVSGVHPAEYSITKLPYSQSCVSKAGIVSTENGVLYPSPDGLFLISGYEGAVLTKDLYNKKQWNELNPEKLIAAYYEGQYIGAFRGTGDLILLNITDSSGIIRLDFGSLEIKSVFHDTVDDALYYLGYVGTTPYLGRMTFLVDSTTAYEWKSKKYTLKSPAYFSCGAISLGDSNSVSLTITCDGDEYSPASLQGVTTSKDFRLPVMVGKIWELTLTGTGTVFSVEIAEAMEELNSV